MRTKLSARFHVGLLGVLAKGDPRPDPEAELDTAMRSGGARPLPSAKIVPSEGPEDVGGAGSGSTDYAEGEAEQEDREASRE